ncbi:MAG: hypothetical protein F6K50_05655 [Moorea sp. SIO3I7]|nr:hypothetical protein [Moorena sp. SIO3I7]
MLTYRNALAFQIEIQSDIYLCEDEIKRIDKKIEALQSADVRSSYWVERGKLVKELDRLNQIKKNEFFDVDNMEGVTPGPAYLAWEKERERRLASYLS